MQSTIAGYRTSSCRGLTLAEILVVVIILGIAAAVVVPMIGNTDGLKATSAARHIVSTLLFAQTNAISSQQQYQVVFDSANDSFEVQDKDGEIIADPVKKMPTGAANPDDYLYKVRLAGDGGGEGKVRIDSANFDGGNKVWFDRLGAPHSGAIADGSPALTVGQVVISAGDTNFTINVEPVTGRVKISE